MFDITKTISEAVKAQFPAFYRTDGPDFVEFVYQYYKWLESEGQIISHGRNLLEYGDIDLTLDKFLDHFIEKYMVGVPLSILSDKRLLQKHILDLYRSKGSFEGIKLLFRLLYNESIELYIPADDILRASDANWIVDRYIEITNEPINRLYDQALITGQTSGTTALVESYQRRNIGNKIVDILFLSNIAGEFARGEVITTDQISVTEGATIIGSLTGFSVVDGSINHAVGDIFEIDSSVTGYNGQAIVTATTTLSGVIEFNIVNGGYGYTTDAIVTITPGSNTSGSGASFVVESLSNTTTYMYNDLLIDPYANVALDAADYSVDGPSDPLFGANASTILGDHILFTPITIGSIATIRTTNPGENYDGSVTVSVIDPYTAGAGIPDGFGGQWGTNAVITGLASFGSGVVSHLNLYDSGFGYYTDGEIVTLYNINDPLAEITARLHIGSLGTAHGYFADTRGMLNADKYLIDSYFYQEYSYQIKSSRSLDKYLDILRQLVHPAGREPFSRVVIQRVVELNVKIIEQSIEQT